MKRSIMRIAGFAAALILVPAIAEGRGYYFNRPGVTREAYMADVAECIELAGGVRPGTPFIPYSPNLIAAGANAFFAGMMRSAERRRLRNRVERTCMADKGYGRYEVNDAVREEIEHLHSDAERLDRLFGFASATAPIGQRMPE